MAAPSTTINIKLYFSLECLNASELLGTLFRSGIIFVFNC
jgi:hypothetical protein